MPPWNLAVKGVSSGEIKQESDSQGGNSCGKVRTLLRADRSPKVQREVVVVYTDTQEMAPQEDGARSTNSQSPSPRGSASP